jgi:uncharacterized metal-binding protein YceD (DUF177 family)
VTDAQARYSRRVGVQKLPKTGQMQRIGATDQDLAAIATQLALPRVEAFSAEMLLRPISGGRYEASGVVRARVWQTCVVSLEDFPADVESPIDALFADPERLPAATRKEVERSLDEEDPPEPLEDGAIDVGALAVEFLALALDPFPRKPGVALEASGDEQPSDNPFAVLAALKSDRA